MGEWEVQSTTPSYRPLVEKYAKLANLDPGLVEKVVLAESGGKPGAVSRKGARGQMQLMPGTARDLNVSDPHDSEENIKAGTRYLAQLHKRFGGDTRMALAAYNWGPENVEKDPELKTAPKETHNFIKKVLGTTGANAATDDWEVVKETPVTKETPSPKSPSFVENVGADLSKRGSNISTIFSPRKDPFTGQPESLTGSIMNVPSRVALTAGQAAGGAMDIAGEGVKSLYKTLMPEAAQTAISGGIEKLAQTGPGRSSIEALKKAHDAYESWKKTNPSQALAVESMGNIAMLAPGAKAAKVGIEGAAPVVGKAAGKVATAIETKALEQATKDTLELVKKDFSTMTKLQKERAMAAGQVEKATALKKAQLKTTKQDIEVAKSIEGIVDKKKNAIENIDAVRAKIAELGEQTKTLPIENDRIFNNREIRTALTEAKEESSVIFSGDKTLEKGYNSVVDEFMRILKGKPNKLSSVLESRKEFDNVIKNKFPNIFSKVSGDNVRANAVKDVRMAANDFVAANLPEGNNFKELLKQQSNMYRATERIAQNAAPSIDKSRFQKLTGIMSRHPWVTAEAAGAVTGIGVMAHYGVGGAIVNTVTNPVALGALMLYGTYKVGKVVVTSNMVRNGLVNFLRATEKTLAPQEKEAVQKVLTSLAAAAVGVKAVQPKESLDDYIK